MRYCAFLRAINVGRHNRIRMDDLRSICSAAGIENVTTYLQTGNVLFEAESDSEATAIIIESALAERGLRGVVAAVRTRAEIAAIVQGDPFEAFPGEEYVHLVTLCRDTLPITAAEYTDRRFSVVSLRDRDVLSAVRRDLRASVDPHAAIERAFKVRGTARYFHVVAAVARLMDG